MPFYDEIIKAEILQKYLDKAFKIFKRNCEYKLNLKFDSSNQSWTECWKNINVNNKGEIEILFDQNEIISYFNKNSFEDKNTYKTYPNTLLFCDIGFHDEQFDDVKDFIKECILPENIKFIISNNTSFLVLPRYDIDNALLRNKFFDNCGNNLYNVYISTEITGDKNHNTQHIYNIIHDNIKNKKYFNIFTHFEGFSLGEPYFRDYYQVCNILGFSNNILYPFFRNKSLQMLVLQFDINADYSFPFMFKEQCVTEIGIDNSNYKLYDITNFWRVNVCDALSDNSDLDKMYAIIPSDNKNRPFDVEIALKYTNSKILRLQFYNRREFLCSGFSLESLFFDNESDFETKLVKIP